MDWKDDNDGYYYVNLPEGGDKTLAIKEWWIKMLSLSRDKKGWNSLIADLWLEGTGRIIGLIQNKEEAVGYDRGFRVSLAIDEYIIRLDTPSDDEYSEEYYLIKTEIDEKLKSTMYLEDVLPLFIEIQNTNPFEVQLSDQGDRFGLPFGPQH